MNWRAAYTQGSQSLLLIDNSSLNLALLCRRAKRSGPVQASRGLYIWRRQHSSAMNRLNLHKELAVTHPPTPSSPHAGSAAPAPWRAGSMEQQKHERFPSRLHAVMMVKPAPVVNTAPSPAMKSPCGGIVGTSQEADENGAFLWRQ
ncbi:hypothetical protein EOD39_17041 [Acipenser ruthenus]|uniref:Uncharacterized protein n=1 Tax=Acipenser ruthenus TaxID=7906 RepID=A0A444V4F6_ACIRT|nr:hypothetical protein EOD39_17041 [Acipenser ruthenus]